MGSRSGSGALIGNHRTQMSNRTTCMRMLGLTDPTPLSSPAVALAPESLWSRGPIVPRLVARDPLVPLSEFLLSNP
jgi:hypothetical protein